MAGLLPGDPSHHGMGESGPYTLARDKIEEHGRAGSSWYFSRREIEENSPSRRDSIDLKKETYFRKSYCTFLQDLGMRLKVPQVTIATAIIFCHRFFLRQSHAKNDRRTIATVCMFLAGKVEETPRPLKDVILVSYEIIHKKDPVSVQKIKQKEVYEQQKELILLGERVVLATLGFDLNVHHPYKPLVEAIKKFKVAQNALAQVAWNFVNDGLRTSLCLQFKPHHIAAGAIFLAAKFLKVKLPSDGEKVWWQEFDVTPRQLEEVSNQMLELYEQNRVAPPPHGSEVEGSGGTSINPRAPSKAPEAVTSVNGYPEVASKHVAGSAGRLDNQCVQQTDTGDVTPNKEIACGGKGEWLEQDGERVEMGEIVEGKEMHNGQNERTGTKGGHGASAEAMKKIDKERLKAALEKRKKMRVEDMVQRQDVLDDNDLIERELESGVELAVAENDKIRWDGRDHRCRISLCRSEMGEVTTFCSDIGETGGHGRRICDGSFGTGREHRIEMVDEENNTEEGELSSWDVYRECSSPWSKNRKRKASELSPSLKDGRFERYAVERDRHHLTYRQEGHPV